MHEACLQWVHVEGVIRHVSDFTDLAPNQRPEAFCPVCGKSVILKLGKFRIHHAAHYEGSICATTQPETALHVNSKYHIQKVLSSIDSLNIWQKCSGWMADNREIQCHKNSKSAVIYAKGWDRVEVEWLYGKYRLDVALLRGEQIVGAIEILVTHPSEEGKIEYLNQQGLAWVEIRVTPEFYSLPNAWTPKTPLEVEACNSSLLTSWQCEQCQTLFKERERLIDDNQRQAELRQQAIDFAKQFNKELFRLIDFYYPSGKKYRKIYIIQSRMQNNQVLCVDLQEVTEQWKQIAVEYPPITEQSYDKLRQALETYLNDQQQPTWLIDKSHSWDALTKGYNLKYYQQGSHHPYNYERVKDIWQRTNQKSNSKQRRPPWRGFGIEIPYETSRMNSLSSSSSKMDEAISSLFKEYTCEICGKITADWVSGNGKTKTCICRDCKNDL